MRHIHQVSPVASEKIPAQLFFHMSHSGIDNDVLPQRMDFHLPLCAFHIQNVLLLHGVVPGLRAEEKLSAFLCFQSARFPAGAFKYITEFFLWHRFQQIVKSRHFKSFHGIFFPCGHENQNRIRSVNAQCSCRFYPPHVLHTDIQQHNIIVLSRLQELSYRVKAKYLAVRLLPLHQAI